MILEISKTLERKTGFLQSKFIDKKFNIQFLLHFCKKNITLEKHKHKHLQFGYNFYGEYEFIIENDLIYIEKNSNYLLNSYIPHEAYALSNYYSLDIKFYGNIFYKKIINSPFNNKISLKTNNAQINLLKIMKKSQIKKNTLIITSTETKIILNNSIINIFPMKIYKINNNSTLTLSNNFTGELLAINYE